MKYRKKPIIVEALQAIPENIDRILEWSTKERPITKTIKDSDGRKIYITTLEGQMTALEHDWIIKGVKGEVYPCKPDIFQETYQVKHYRRWYCNMRNFLMYIRTGLNIKCHCHWQPPFGFVPEAGCEKHD